MSQFLHPSVRSVRSLFLILRPIVLFPKLYSTLSLFTQVYKWVLAIIMLGGNQLQYSQSLHATETRIKCRPDGSVSLSRRYRLIAFETNIMLPFARLFYYGFKPCRARFSRAELRAIDFVTLCCSSNCSLFYRLQLPVLAGS